MPVTRLANPSDIPAIVSVVNTAFAIETFLEGQRADQARLTQMMKTGDILIAEGDGEARAACIYVRRGSEDPPHKSVHIDMAVL